MLINAVNRANPVQRKELMGWINAKTFNRQEKIAAVTRLYDEIGIRQLCEKKINYFFEESKKYLEKVGVPNERKEQLRRYTNEMMHRDK